MYFIWSIGEVALITLGGDTFLYPPEIKIIQQMWGYEVQNGGNPMHSPQANCTPAFNYGG